MDWDDLPLWWRRWLRYRRDNPPDPPPGPNPYGGPTVPPAEQTIEVGGLDTGAARRNLASLTDTLVALPLRPAGTRPVEAVEVAVAPEPLAHPTARQPLTLDPIPTTPPILADQPTFYGRGERGEPDLIAGRAIRAHGQVTHPAGVDVDASDTPDGNAPTGTAYRGGTNGYAGDFHVDTTDGWASTPQVSFEAWVRPTSLVGTQSLLDARSIHRHYGDRWLWTTARTILGQLVRELADILGDYNPLDDWPRWRGLAVFAFWQAWWTRAALQLYRHQMGWELHTTGTVLVASFGAGDTDAPVAVAGKLAVGRWSHVAATCDGTTRQLYVDGELVATATGTRYVPPVPGVDLVIGRASSAAIDEIAIYDYVLSPEQIAAHRAGIGTGNTRGLPDNTTVLPLRPVAARTLTPVDVPLEARPQQPDGAHPIKPAATRVRALPLSTGPSDAALAEAITDDLRRPIYTVRADWARDGGYNHPLSDLTGLVEDLTIDRSYAGELPAEVGLVDGAAAAALTMRIAGQWDTEDDDATGLPADTGITSPAHDNIDAVAAFAPYNPDAPLFGHPTVGTPIEADIGFLTREGRRLLRRFTGTVSRVNPSSRERNVQIDGLDMASRLRAPITQQATGMDGITAARYGPDRYNSRINSHWLADRILRANGFYASPPPQPGAFISATCHGSTVPEIGSGGIPRRANLATPSNPAAWVGGLGATGAAAGDHPHHMMYANPEGMTQSGVWTAPEQLTMNPGDGYGCSGLFRMPANPAGAYLFGCLLNGGPVGPKGVTAGDYAIVVYFEGGAPAIYIYTPANGFIGGAVPWVPPRRAEWHHVGFHWSFRTSAAPQPDLKTNIPVDVVLTVAIDGDNYDPLTYTLNIGNVRGNPWAPSTTVEYNMGGGIRFTNISWFRAPIAPTDQEWVGPGHVSMADVEPGLNELTGIPQISGEDSLELLTDLAAAEGARVGFSVGGRPFWRTRAVHRDLGAPEEITDRDLADMVTVTDEAGVRNSISSAVTPLLIEDFEWVVDSKDATQFEAGPGTSYFRVTLPADTVLVEPWYIYQFSSRVGWEALHDHPVLRNSWLFQAVYAHNPKLVVPATNQPISLGLFPGGPGEIIIVVYNYTGRTIRFATEDKTDTNTGLPDRGSAAFKLPGRLLKAQATQPQTIVDPASVGLFGEQTHELGGTSSRWHQHDRAIRGVAEAILAQTAHPAPVLDRVTVRHDPRRDLGDTVRLVDPHGLGSVRGTVTGITTTLSTTSAVVDELTVRAIAPPGFGVLDDEELGKVGVSLRFGA